MMRGPLPLDCLEKIVLISDGRGCFSLRVIISRDRRCLSRGSGDRSARFMISRLFFAVIEADDGEIKRIETRMIKKSMPNKDVSLL